jgi:hypothetical protein
MRLKRSAYISHAPRSKASSIPNKCSIATPFQRVSMRAWPQKNFTAPQKPGILRQNPPQNVRQNHGARRNKIDSCGPLADRIRLDRAGKICRAQTSDKKI